MDQDKITVLGIDPGTAIIGYAVLNFTTNSNIDDIPEIVDYGAIKTAKDTRPRRLRVIHNSILSLIERFAPQVLAVERVFFQKNIRTAMSVGEAQGVIMLAAAQSDMEVFEYTPLQVKETLTGHGRASKEEMQFVVQTLLSLERPPRPDDVADALAIAFCHISNIKLGLASSLS